MKTQLHEVFGKNRYCGPTVIATVCGVSTDEASRVVRSTSGKKSVCFMSDRQLIGALKALGCTVEYHVVPEPVTANQWIKSNKALFKEHHVILNHGRHYGTLLGSGFLCSLSERMVVSLSQIPKLKAKVASYFLVTSLPEQIGSISSTRFPLKALEPKSEADMKIVGYALSDLQDDPESSTFPSGRTIKLSREEYLSLERAMQWPEDLAQYDKNMALNSQGLAASSGCHA